MQDKVIIAYKNLGETPLECLERVRLEKGILQNIPMTYAGRLDPMAEGLMILLVGAECKNKDKYLGFDKTYEFEILVGFSTDTYDLLGKVIGISSEYKNSSRLNPLYGGSDADSEFLHPDFMIFNPGQTISSTLSELQGKFVQKYPSFSSKTVNGKQLFQIAKDDELPEDLPEHEVTISKLSYISARVIGKEILHKEILRRIALVKGGFRQNEITKNWEEVFDKIDQKEFQIISLVCDCSSGTYIRQLVNDMGAKLSIPIVTYSIKRTKIGSYTIGEASK